MYIEKEIYAERKYYINMYYKHYIKAFFYFLKMKYYNYKHMRDFMKG